MGLKTYKTWFDFWQEQENFLFCRVFQWALGLTQPSVLCILWYYFTRQIQQGHEYDHSPQSNAEVKKVSSYASALPYALMVWCLIMQRDKFKVTFTRGFVLSSILDSLHQRNFMLDRFLLLPGSTKDGFCCFVITEFEYLCSSDVMHCNVLWQRQDIHCSVWCSEGTYFTRGSICTGHGGTGFGTTSTREKAEEESVHTAIYVCLHRSEMSDPFFRMS